MSTRPAFWRSPLGWLCVALIAVAAGFAATGHAAHALSVLAWLAILACPLLHMFLHVGHHHGPRESGKQADGDGHWAGNKR